MNRTFHKDSLEEVDALNVSFKKESKRVQKMAGLIHICGTAIAVGTAMSESISDSVIDNVEKLWKPIRIKIQQNGWGTFEAYNVTDEITALNLARYYYTKNS